MSVGIVPGSSKFDMKAKRPCNVTCVRTGFISMTLCLYHALLLDSLMFS